MILTIDPSSSCIGYAAWDGDTLTEFGRYLPTKRTDDANARIARMVADLVTDWSAIATDAVIEDTSGKVGARHGRGGGAGLAVYGKAIGWVRGSLEASGVDCHMVRENEWTRGCRKLDRIAAVAATVAKYDPAQDKGGDIADAIALGFWWLNVQRSNKMRLLAKTVGKVF